MKYLIILLSTLLSFQVMANDQVMLSSEEFKSLSREDQARYLRAVQRIMASMTQQSLYMAENSEMMSRMPAAAKQSQEFGADELLANEYSPDQSKKVEGKKGFIITIGGKTSTQAETVVAAADPTPTSAPAVSSTRDTPASPQASAWVVAPTPLPSPIVTRTNPIVPAQAPKAEKKPASEQAATKPTNAGGNTDKAAKKDVIIEEKASEQGKIRNTRNNYRCMYAGWIILKDPCNGHDEFPDYYSIDGIDRSKMKCASGKTMCNPTVFGLNLPKGCKKFSDEGCSTKATPICVSKGAWPTVDCYHQSNYENALVAAEINSEVVPQKYDSFVKTFADLCDPEQIKSNPLAEVKNRKKRNVPADVVRKDISVTCDWAVEKLKQVKQAMDTKDKYTKETWSEQQKNSSQKLGDPRSKKEGSQQ